MFGFSFSFWPVLLALPLAAVPVLLHLLHQRRSPILLFSTIRFIQSSVQKTAARKRLQRWLLLACRVILLALLIAAVAQPKKDPARGWASKGKSAVAAIVIDTSYSMQLEDHQQTLLARADAALHELLTGQLASAKVAIFRSLAPPPGQPEPLDEALKIDAQIERPIFPQPNPEPLVNRIAAAVRLLDDQAADDKWLVVISDFQKREFPSQFPHPKTGHILLIDLHPQTPRSAGITRVVVDPLRPTPGTESDAVVDVSGRPNTSRPVKVFVETYTGQPIWESGVQVASLDSAGRSTLRFRLKLPAQPWLVLRASLQDDDDMKWDDSRTHLIQTPPRQVVTFLGPQPSHDAWQFPVWLALDPLEGEPGPWPLQVKAGEAIAPDANVAVLLAEDWPDDARTTRLLNFVRGGGRLILFVRPGLEETWANLPPNRKNALLALLPSEPVKIKVAPVNTVSIAAENDPQVARFKPDWFNGVVVQRLLPFSLDAQGTMVLKCFPQDPRPGFRPAGLLYRRNVGAGAVYCFATLPNAEQYSNIALLPVFVPLLVGMAQPPLGQGDAQNIELGQLVSISGRALDPFDSVTIQPPAAETDKPQSPSAAKETIVVPADAKTSPRHFTLGPANRPGLYTWLRPGSDDPLAITNVRLPAGESDLVYTPAAATTEPGENVVVVQSVSELATRITDLGKPQPQWALPISIVLLLLCVEALMASLSRLWKPGNLKAVVPGVAPMG